MSLVAMVTIVVDIMVRSLRIATAVGGIDNSGFQQDGRGKQQQRPQRMSSRA